MQQIEKIKMLKLGILHTALNTTGFDTLKNKEIDVKSIAFDTFQEGINALRAGDIDIISMPFKDTPIDLPAGIVIAALSERIDARQCLVFLKNTATDFTQFSELENPKILTFNDLNSKLIQHILPSSSTETQDLMPSDGIEQVNKNAYQACILPLETVKMLDLDPSIWHVQAFSPREFTPEIGQGVTCFIVDEEDLPTRRLLQNKVHQRAVAILTNVERSLKKLLSDTPIAAYCERDKGGNYHFSAAILMENSVKTVRLSQSTVFELAERAKEQLMN